MAATKLARTTAEWWGGNTLLALCLLRVLETFGHVGMAATKPKSYTPKQHVQRRGGDGTPSFRLETNMFEFKQTGNQQVITTHPASDRSGT